MIEPGGVTGGDPGGLPSGRGGVEAPEVDERPRPRLEREEREDEIDPLLEELERARARIAELERSLADAERARELEARLREAGAVDLETATTMALAILERNERESDGEPVSEADAVGELLRTKPFLFAAPVGGPGVVGMAGMPSPAIDDAARLAERARETGDRRLLLRYLRVRRGE